MNTCFTIGHSNLPEQDFIKALAGNGIECLVDVRSLPYSRFYPQYSQNRLRGALAAAHIAYVFLGDALGGRIKDPDCFIGQAIPAAKPGMAKLVRYEVLITKEWFLKGIGELQGHICARRTAIMCSEEDPEACHRKLLIARALVSEGYEVVHIRTKPPAQNPGLDLFAEA